jgi:hypothetical protein
MTANALTGVPAEALAASTAAAAIFSDLLDTENEGLLCDALGCHAVWFHLRYRHGLTVRNTRIGAGLQISELAPSMVYESNLSIRPFREFEHSIPCRLRWIPACAGMTRARYCAARSFSLDSRLRGNNGRRDSSEVACRRDDGRERSPMCYDRPLLMGFTKSKESHDAC